MNLKDKMDLRILAINALYTYIDKFSLEDDDYIDYRAVRGKERALDNRIKKMSEMTIKISFLPRFCFAKKFLY